MIQILVSACLLGENCKWDGTNNKNQEVLDFMDRLKGQAEFHLMCPEQAGGLPTPRPAAEIRVTDGTVVNTEKQDVTEEFVRGAAHALKEAETYGCAYALLKERSPSCGSGEIYDGTFSHTRVKGQGKTAELLTEHGIEVFGETEISSLEEKIRARLQ